MAEHRAMRIVPPQEVGGLHEDVLAVTQAGVRGDVDRGARPGGQGSTATQPPRRRSHRPVLPRRPLGRAAVDRVATPTAVNVGTDRTMHTATVRIRRREGSPPAVSGWPSLCEPPKRSASCASPAALRRRRWDAISGGARKMARTRSTEPTTTRSSVRRPTRWPRAARLRTGTCSGTRFRVLTTCPLTTRSPGPISDAVRPAPAAAAALPFRRPKPPGARLPPHPPPVPPDRRRPPHRQPSPAAAVRRSRSAGPHRRPGPG